MGANMNGISELVKVSRVERSQRQPEARQVSTTADRSQVAK
jgi:hypothetical protein